MFEVANERLIAMHLVTNSFLLLGVLASNLLASLLLIAMDLVPSSMVSSLEKVSTP